MTWRSSLMVIVGLSLALWATIGALIGGFWFF